MNEVKKKFPYMSDIKLAKSHTHWNVTAFFNGIHYGTNPNKIEDMKPTCKNVLAQKKKLRKFIINYIKNQYEKTKKN